MCVALCSYFTIVCVCFLFKVYLCACCFVYIFQQVVFFNISSCIDFPGPQMT